LHSNILASSISSCSDKFKGVRQEDHLSPFLFNLVANTLSKILQTAQQEGYIKGLENFNGLNIKKKKRRRGSPYCY
jgi:hypothetical protein